MTPTPEQIEIPEAFENLMNQETQGYGPSASVWKSGAIWAFRHLSIPHASQTYPRWVKASEQLPDDNPSKIICVRSYSNCESAKFFDGKFQVFIHSMNSWRPFITANDKIEWLSEDPATLLASDDKSWIKGKYNEWLKYTGLDKDSHPALIALNLAAFMFDEDPAAPPVEEKGIRDRELAEYRRELENVVQYFKDEGYTHMPGYIQETLDKYPQPSSSPTLLPQDKKPIDILFILQWAVDNEIRKFQGQWVSKYDVAYTDEKIVEKFLPLDLD